MLSNRLAGCLNACPELARSTDWAIAVIAFLARMLEIKLTIFFVSPEEKRLDVTLYNSAGRYRLAVLVTKHSATAPEEDQGVWLLYTAEQCKELNKEVTVPRSANLPKEFERYRQDLDLLSTAVANQVNLGRAFCPELYKDERLVIMQLNEELTKIQELCKHANAGTKEEVADHAREMFAALAQHRINKKPWLPEMERKLMKIYEMYFHLVRPKTLNCAVCEDVRPGVEYVVLYCMHEMCQDCFVS